MYKSVSVTEYVINWNKYININLKQISVVNKQAETEWQFMPDYGVF